MATIVERQQGTLPTGRRPGRRRRAAVAAGLVLAVAACGGGAGTDSSDTDLPDPARSEAAPADLPAPIDVGAAIVAAHGPDDGFAAVLYAVDAGYSTVQITDAALGAGIGPDGMIAGVDPEGSTWDLIAAPVVGFARRSTEPAQYTPEEVDAALQGKLLRDGTIELLGAPLGVGPEANLDRPAPEPATPSAVGPELAEQMIGTILTLIDVGYSFDQALTGWLFGETELAIGADTSGETEAGLPEYGDYPVATCLALRDADGTVVRPAGSGANAFFASATCERALKAGTVSFDGLESLLAGESDGGDEPADADSTPGGDAGESGGGVRSFSGAVDLSDLGLGETALHNAGEVVASDQLVGTIEFYGEGPMGLSAEDDWICSGMRFVLPPGDVTSTGPNTYAGTGEFYLAFQDGRCNGAPTFQGPGPIRVDATIDGSTLVAAITVINPDDGDETILQFAATEVPA